MPLVFKKNIAENCWLALWHITESNETLHQMLDDGFIEHNKEHRIQSANAKHYLSSRLLISQHYSEHSIQLIKDAHNKPHVLLGPKEIPVAITHSYDYAAVMVGGEMGLGIDLEKVDPRVGRVKKKFMHTYELEFAGNESQILEQTLIWSAKETLYKIYGKGQLDFRDNMKIDPFQATTFGTLNGKIETDSLKVNVPVQYEQIGNYVLTYAQFLLP